MKKTKLKLFGVSVPFISIGSLPDHAPVPSTPTKFVSPRYEPSNITQNSTMRELQAALREAEAPSAPGDNTVFMKPPAVTTESAGG